MAVAGHLRCQQRRFQVRGAFGQDVDTFVQAHVEDAFKGRVFVIYDMIYVPIRTVIFLVIVSIWFDVSFARDGYIPALLILMAFIPFVWGIGSIASASVLTFRRGSGVIGFGTFALTFTSGAYFPLALFPDWVETLAKLNPIAVAITGMREQLLGDAGWADAASVLLRLVPMSTISLLLGLYAFRLAMRRERRLGTLGLY